MEKGQEREKNLTKNAYFSDSYFTDSQLFSFVEQLQHIKLCLDRINVDKDKIKILEIGKGNGFISSFFKNMGYKVVTFDINKNLIPDVVGDILELSKHFEPNSFDLVVCCEVLEHLPFEYFEKALEQIFIVNNNMLFLTLPEYKSFSGFSLFLQVFNRKKVLSFRIGTQGKHKLSKEHFWELDYTRKSSKSAIRNILERYSLIKDTGRFRLNPYHNFFILEKKKD